MFKMFKFGLLLMYLVVSTISVITDEMKELAAQLHNTCVAETGVAEDTIAGVNKNKVLPDDEKLKCYLKCVMAETAVIDEHGVTNPEAFIAILPEELQAEAIPVVKKCDSKDEKFRVGTNPCENVWQTHQCYLTERPDLYMII